MRRPATRFTGRAKSSNAARPAAKTAGRIPPPEVAESVLENRGVDLVAIARPTLCDPRQPGKIAEDREQEILRCVYCSKRKEADEAFQKVYGVQWGKERRGQVEVRSHRRHSSRV